MEGQQEVQQSQFAKQAKLTQWAVAGAASDKYKREAELRIQETLARKKRAHTTRTVADEKEIAANAQRFGPAKAKSMYEIKYKATIAETTVRAYRDKWAKEGSTPNDSEKPNKGGRPGLLTPEQVEKTKELLTELREGGCKVSAALAASVIRGVVAAEGKGGDDGEITFGERFGNNFLTIQMGWSHRAATSGARHAPAGSAILSEVFRCRVHHFCAKYNIPPSRVWNMDQTFAHLLPASKKTFAPPGKVAMEGHTDKRGITVLLTTSAAGEMAPIQGLWGGKTSRCLPDSNKWPETWDMYYTANHWSTEESNMRWADLYCKFLDKWRREHGLPPDCKIVLIIDIFAANRAEAVIDKLSNNNVQCFFIPGRMTDELQPNDDLVNNVFKKHFSKSFSQWQSDQVRAHIEGGGKGATFCLDKRLSSIKGVHATWVRSAIESITKEHIVASWRHTGLLSAIAPEYAHITFPESLNSFGCDDW